MNNASSRNGEARDIEVPAWQAWLIWGFGPALFFYAFFQRVAPSIMID